MFKLVSDFQPKGDQPQAIEKIVAQINDNVQDQVLMGCTGSGKTFTMANVIAQTQRPTLIMAPNKTLAAQLYSEMCDFFPHNNVEYFVSYYDYYQPEAYVPKTDTFIEKESSINEQIDRMRHSATRALLEDRHTIVIASVSCIYGIGDVEMYGNMILNLRVGQEISMRDVRTKLVELQYKTNNTTLQRGSFRAKGDVMDIFPAHSDSRIWRISFFGDLIEDITEIDSLTGQRFDKIPQIRLYASSHYVISRPTVNQAVGKIKKELAQQIAVFKEQNKLIEAQRLEERITYDLEMMASTGFCSGIENYSRYLTGREPGSPPPTLYEYLPKDSLLIVDESHIAVRQIGGMYKGDRARKDNLALYGFRLPSCRDNRPLKFEEWDGMRPQTVYVSATPAEWELQHTNYKVIEQIIRPTGLIDPICDIVSSHNQVDHLMQECHKVIKNGFRVLVTTLTKKMSEELAEYMENAGIKSKYLHSDIDTLERIEILRDLRNGDFDVLIGVNLLREGLDIPECALVAILDADKEGLLRNYTSLIQTIGRAARNSEGRVIFYADRMTKSINESIAETNRRRKIQMDYNEKHGIKPKTILKKISNALERENNDSNNKSLQKQISATDQILTECSYDPIKIRQKIKKLDVAMTAAANSLDFEQAAKLRDQINDLKKQILLI